MQTPSDVEPTTPLDGSELPVPEARATRATSGRIAGVARLAGHKGAEYLGVGGVLLALIVFLTITNDKFATYDNLRIILETNAVLLILAVGLTFVLLSGGIDLSVGAMLALSGVTMKALIDVDVPVGLAIVIVIIAAAAFGALVNGVLVAKVRLSFLVVTLGTALILRGIALVWTGGLSESLFNEQFLLDLGSGRVAGIPWSVIVALTAFGLSTIVVRYTGYGRMLYATGGNRQAARLAGINTTMIGISVFGIAAGFAGLAGVLDAARLASASPTAGTGSTTGTPIELTAAAAVLLGGTSFMGGRGTMLGTLLGVLFLGVLSNGITLLGISAFWQGIVTGIVLIAAVLLDRVRSPRRE